MDFGLNGKNALVCASSKGLGKACAVALAHEGANVLINGRNEESLQQALEDIRSVGKGEMQAVCCDVTTDEGREQLLAAAPDLDILVNNAGGPPAGDFHDWGREEWFSAVNANMFTPIELIKLTVDGMMERGFGRIVNITSSAVKAPISVLGLSNGARAGLTGYVAGVSRQVVSKGVTINNILPGRFDTDRLRGIIHFQAEKTGQSFEKAFEQGKTTIPAGRYGHPDEFGHLCAYFCSQQAGYITGQNIVIDGGTYPGTL